MTAAEGRANEKLEKFERQLAKLDLLDKIAEEARSA